MVAIATEGGRHTPEYYATKAGNPIYGNPIYGARTVILPGGYAADIIGGEDYDGQKDHLIEMAARIQSDVFQRDFGVAREVAVRNMDVPPRSASIIFVRLEGAPIGEYIGFASQRILTIADTSQGDVPLLYFSTRAFLAEHRRKHLGRYVLQHAAAMHREASWAGHRTQSPAAVRSMEESGIFQPDLFFPKNHFYGDRRYDPDNFAQEIMGRLFMQVRRRGRWVDGRTGVSMRDYFEPNGAYIPDPTHGPTEEIRRWMVDKLRMNFQRGDSLYEVGKLK